ncbi:fibronectin type III domain-containing protein [Mangrovimonas aestuarii]|uniref:fibronectin type III domain-containing protein n=1 Tax=Mangrovimonas aestuarii TaxID=3018443 RepID=UPI0023797962|nr:fibronectin type III domain-containing protein [Mangrovimonas aestuarii]
MKKISLWLLALCCVLISQQGFSQYTLPTIGGPQNVVAGSNVTLNLNDSANTDDFPTNYYQDFIVTAFWSSGNGAWSSQAGITMVTSAGSVSVTPPTSGGMDGTFGTQLTFTGTLPAIYDPSVDGTLNLILSQSMTGTNGIWSGINVTLIPGCYEPTGLNAINVTQNAADLVWTVGDSETSWNIEYGVSGFALGTGTAVNGLTTNSYSINGLVADSNYQFYVQADCGDNNSIWSGPYTLHTLCDAVTAPITQNFANPITPICWFTTGPDTYTWKFDLGAYTPSENVLDYTSSGDTYYAWVDGSDLDTGDSASLTTVPIDVSGLTNPSLSFALFSRNTWSDISNDIDIEVFDGSSWNNVFSLTEVLGADWQEFFVDLSDLTITDDIMVRFTVSADSDATVNYFFHHNDVLFDNIVIDEMPSCVQPVTITASEEGISSNSIELSWEEQDSNPNSWNVEVVTSGTTPTGVATHTAGTNPFTITGLTGNTTYDIYIQTSCSNGNNSTWVGPHTVTTVCGAFDSICEDFNGIPTGTSVNPNTPDCWFFLDTGNGFGHVKNEAFYINNYTDQVNDYMLVSPQINNLSSGNNQVTFGVKASSSNPSAQQFIVGTMSDPELGSTFTSIGTYTVTATYPQLEEFTVTIPSGTNQYLAFKHGLAGLSINLFFDNICIEAIPTCAEVQNITNNNITNNSVEVSWTTGDDEIAWNIEYVPAGLAQGSGATVSADSNPFVIDGLTGNTEYDIYVQANCGNGDLGEWVEGPSFTTLCDPFGVLPLCEEFDEAEYGNASYPTIEECWTFIDGGPGYGYVHFSESFLMKNLSDPTGDYILVSPGVNTLSNGNNRVTFDAKGLQGTDLIVGTLTYALDSSTFTAIETITLSSNEYESFIVDIPVGTDTYVGIKHGLSANNLTYNIDSVCIEERPSCLEVSDVVIDPISNDSATIAWTVNGNETEWIVEYGVAGFEQGTGMEETTTASPFTLQGLIGGIQYEIYIQANCGGGDLAAWTGPISFTTECGGVFTPDYLQNFENTLSLGQACWTEGSASTIAEGPNGSDSAWVIDGFNNDGITGSARINLNSNTKMDWLVSPVFDLSAGGYGLRFEAGVTAHNNTNPGYMGSDDEVKVLISEDNGTTWAVLETWISGDHPFNAGYEALIDLTDYTSSTARIAVWANEGTVDDAEDYDFFIDNIEITSWSTLGIEEDKIVGLVYYPNPISDILNIRAEKNLREITVYNIIGQKVLTNVVNSRGAQIDMSVLNAGAYFVKVSTDDSFETLRVIKQ